MNIACTLVGNYNIKISGVVNCPLGLLWNYVISIKLSPHFEIFYNKFQGGKGITKSN